MKKIIIFWLIFCLASYTVFATDIAYIIGDANSPDPNIVDALDGYSYDVIDGDYNMVNYSQYLMILVGDDYISNPNAIPVKNMRSLVLNTYYVDTWGLAQYISTSSIGNNYLKGRVLINHNITEGYSGLVQLYNSYGIQFYYLPKLPDRAKGVVKLVGTNDVDELPIIGVINPGGLLYGGGAAKDRIVFYGLPNSNYWTNNAKDLLRNSISWLISDLIPPIITDVQVNNLTNQSARITWQTDKGSNSTVLYSEDLGLGLIVSNNSIVEGHEIILKNLKELTTYNYMIRSCNVYNYCRDSFVMEFTTTDLTAPYLVSNSINDVTNTAVNISVTTNEDAALRIFYGVDQNHINSYVEEPSYSTEADVYIGNLNEKTLYYYIIGMCDQYNNCRNSSLYDFTTLDFTPPNVPGNLMLKVNNSNNNIKISWNSVADAVLYNVYIADSLDSFDFNNPVISLQHTEYTDNSASVIQHRYYIVRAEDNVGNEEKNTNIVGKLDLNLIKGYNLVSFPLVPFDNSVGKVMHQDTTYHPVSEIKRYNNGFLETIFFDGLGWGLGIFNELNALEGYFFKSDENVDFTIVGSVPSEIILDLNEGLNLVGLTLFDIKQIDESITQSPSDYDITEIASRNADGSYVIATYYPSEDGWFMADDFNINSGFGYWVKANKESELVIS